MMSYAVQLVVLFVVCVNICRVKSFNERNEVPLSRRLYENRNEISKLMADADLSSLPPTICLIQKLQTVYSNYRHVRPFTLYTTAERRVLSANAECDYVMIDVEGQHRSRLELNGHDITDKLLMVSNSCYSVILNSNEYDLRLWDSTCNVNLRIVTGSPIVTVTFLKGFRGM